MIIALFIFIGHFLKLKNKVKSILSVFANHLQSIDNVVLLPAQVTYNNDYTIFIYKFIYNQLFII